MQGNEFHFRMEFFRKTKGKPRGVSKNGVTGNVYADTVWGIFQGEEGFVLSGLELLFHDNGVEEIVIYEEILVVWFLLLTRPQGVQITERKG